MRDRSPTGPAQKGRPLRIAGQPTAIPLPYKSIAVSYLASFLLTFSTEGGATLLRTPLISTRG